MADSLDTLSASIAFPSLIQMTHSTLAIQALSGRPKHSMVELSVDASIPSLVDRSYLSRAVLLALKNNEPWLTSNHPSHSGHQRSNSF